MIAGIEIIRKIFSQKALQEFVGEETKPGKLVSSKADLIHYIKSSATLIYHACGTCRMGDPKLPASGNFDPKKLVVDTDLRVIGIHGLRVVDGSVLPSIPSGNTNAPIIMIAEKAADLMLGNHS